MSDQHSFGMLMPERSGFKTDGGWSTGNEQVNGTSVNQTLTVNDRDLNTPDEYKATTWIELTDGFESGSTDEFVAYIANGINTTAGNTSSSGGENNSYRYGFNGKENDNEVKGVGNELDYGWRSYDTRLGRFISFDPLYKGYPDLSPYHFAGLNPIQNIDRDGGEPEDYRVNWQYKTFTKGGVSSYYHMSNDPQLGYIDVEVVYDNWTKRQWFIHQSNTGQYFYWKHDPGADQRVRIVSNTPGESNGGWSEFETQDNKQARYGCALAKGMATTVFGMAVVGTASFAIAEGAAVVASSVITFSTNLATQAVVNYYRWAPLVGGVGRTAAGILDESGAVGAQNASLSRIEQYAANEIKKFVSTEAGALWQVDKFKQIFTAGGAAAERALKEEILAVAYNGKTFILDGHNRLKALSELNQSANVTVLSVEEATKRFKDKMTDIVNGSFTNTLENEQ